MFIKMIYFWKNPQKNRENKLLELMKRKEKTSEEAVWRSVLDRSSSGFYVWTSFLEKLYFHPSVAAVGSSRMEPCSDGSCLSAMLLTWFSFF